MRCGRPQSWQFVQVKPCNAHQAHKLELGRPRQLTLQVSDLLLTSWSIAAARRSAEFAASVQIPTLGCWGFRIPQQTLSQQRLSNVDIFSNQGLSVLLQGRREGLPLPCKYYSQAGTAPARFEGCNFASGQTSTTLHFAILV